MLWALAVRPTNATAAAASRVRMEIEFKGANLLLLRENKIVDYLARTVDERAWCSLAKYLLERLSFGQFIDQFVEVAHLLRERIFNVFDAPAAD